MIKLLDNSLLFLICLIPISLISGPFLPDLFLTLSSIIFLILCFYKNNFKYFNNLYFKSFLLFWIYVCFISLLSGELYYSFGSAFVYIRFILFALAVWYILDYKDNTIKFFFISLTVSFTVVLITGYIQYFFNVNFTNYIYDGKRLTGLFGDEQILGSYLSRLYPIFLALLFYLIKKPKILILCFLFSFIMLDVLIFLSGERTAFVYVILLSALTIFCLQNYKLTRLASFIISALIIVFVVSNDSVVKERMVNNTIDNLNLNNKYGERLLVFSPAHENIFKTSLKIYKDNPYIGIGMKMFRIECKKEEYYDKVGCRNHPHNSYIQLLVETGIPGFIYFFTIFILISIILFNQLMLVVLKKNILNLKKNLTNYDVCLLIAIFITLWPIAPTGNFFHNWLNVIYFLPIGFLLSSIYKK